MFPRQALAAFLTVLLACPAWTNPNVVGTAAASKGATVRGSTLLPGSTIFSGDTIATGQTGSASISLTGGAQVRVGSESRIRLTRKDEKALLELTRGRAAFRVSNASPFEARFADATLRPAGGDTAVAFINMTGERTALIAAEKGSWVVSTAHDAKSVTLRENEGVEVTLAPAPPAPQAGGASGASSLSGTWIAILGVIVAGIVTGVAVFRNSDETNLSDTDKRNEVSPFRFP